MKYTNEDLEEIYNDFQLDTLGENHSELLPYKKIFHYVFERVFFFDELRRHKNKNNYLYSCAYLRELIHICNKIPKEKLDDIDEKLFYAIEFGNAPYDITSLNYLRTVLIPKDMIEKDYKKYNHYFRKYFRDNYNRLIVNNRMEDISKYNNMDKFISAIFYVYFMTYMINRYEDFLIFFFSYFYANEFDEEEIKNSLKKINKNFDYYYDLVTMNISNNLNIEVYYFIESLLKEKDNKKLIK